MSENSNGAKELFKSMVKAGRRTYFFSVKEASNNRKYLTVTESKLVEKDKFDRFSIMVFQDKMEEFMKALQEASLAVA